MKNESKYMKQYLVNNNTINKSTSADSKYRDV